MTAPTTEQREAHQHLGRKIFGTSVKANQARRKKMSQAEAICGKTAEELDEHQRQLREQFRARQST